MHAYCAGLPEPFELECPSRWQIAAHCGSGSWPWVRTTRYLLRLDMTFLRTTRERHRDCVQNSSQARCLFRLSAQPNMYMHICMYVRSIHMLGSRSNQKAIYNIIIIFRPWRSVTRDHNIGMPVAQCKPFIQGSFRLARLI